jgi:hypothetical protein
MNDAAGCHWLCQCGDEHWQSQWHPTLRHRN